MGIKKYSSKIILKKVRELANKHNLLLILTNVPQVLDKHLEVYINIMELTQILQLKKHWVTDMR